MKKYRYPGAPPFAYEDRKLFYGRKDDINRFFKFVSIEPLVVLYSRSGLGKSSMINAGFVPKLIDETNFEPFQVKFSSAGEGSTASPVDIVVDKIKKSVKQETFLPNIAESDGSMWYYLKSLQIAAKGEKDFFLIFDQFENLFTFSQKQESDFVEQLANLLNVTIPQHFRDELEKKLAKDRKFLSRDQLNLLFKPLKVHIVIAIRSDKMSLLNRLKVSLPHILNRTFQLEALNRTQAKDAIILPAQVESDDFLSPEFEYSESALNAMLDFLSKGVDKKIESFQLQILCQYIEENIVIKKKKLLVEAKEDLHDISAIFENYYDSIIETLPKKEQLKARVLIEEGLIFEEDMRRLNLYEGQIFKKYEISKKTLSDLFEKRLLRSEPATTGTGYSYELSHDTLVAPILKAKAKRIQADEIKKARLEEEEKRKEEQLEAERVAEIKRIEDDRRRKKRRVVAIAALAIIVLAILFSMYSLYQEQKLQGVVADLKNARVKDSMKSVQLEKQKDSIRTVNETLTATTTDLQETNKELEQKESDLEIALKEANIQRDKARKSFFDLHDAIQKLYMTKAKEELEEKHYNGARLYVMYARKERQLLKSDDSEMSAYLSKIKEYPVEVWKPEYRQKMWQVDYSPDEKLVASPEIGSGNIVLWDVTSGNEVRMLKGHSMEVSCLSFRPDSNFLASASNDLNIIIWDTTSWVIHDSIKIKHDSSEYSYYYYDEIIDLQYSPLNGYLAALTYDGDSYYVHTWATDDSQKIVYRQKFGKRINALAFSHDGTKLAIAPKDNAIIIYDIKNISDTAIQHIEENIGDKTQNVNSISFSLDNKLLATGMTNENEITIWDIESKKKVATLEEHEGNITCLQFGPGAILASGDDENVIKLWKIDTTQYEERQIAAQYRENLPDAEKPDTSFVTLKNHRKKIVQLQFLSGGKKLASLGEGESTMKVWTIEKDKSTGITSKDQYVDKETGIDGRIKKAEKDYNLRKIGSELVMNWSVVDSLYTVADKYPYDYDKLIHIYDTILQLSPKEYDARYGLADALYWNQEYTKAIENYLIYTKRFPESYESWDQLGQMYYRQGDWNNAIFCLDKAIAIDSTNDYNYINKGIAHYELKENEKAIHSYNQALKINPDYIAFGLLGEVYLEENKLEEALYYFKAGIENNSYWEFLYYGIGRVYAELNFPDSATIMFEEAIVLDPNHANALAELGRLYYLRKDYKDAYLYSLKAIAANDTVAKAWYTLGDLTRTTDPERALDFYLKASRLDQSLKDNAYYLKALGTCFYDMNEYDQAIKKYQTAFKQSDRDPILKILTAMAATRNSKTAVNNSKTLYKQGLSLPIPDTADKAVFAYRGYANIAIGKLNEALSDLTISMDTDSAYDQAYVFLACYYAMNDEVEKAMDNLEMAFNLKYVNYGWIENEPLLKGIKKSNRYSPLHKKMKLSKNELADWQQEEFTKTNLVVLGNEYVEERNYIKALYYYDSAYNYFENNEGFMFKYSITIAKLAEDYLINKNYDSAFNNYKKLWTINPEFDFYELDYFGDEDDRYFHVDEAGYEESLYSWSEVADAFYHEKEYALSEELYELTVAIDDLYDSGLEYLEYSDTVAAINTFNYMLEKDPGNLDALESLVMVYFFQKDYDSLYFVAKKTVEFHPELQVAYLFYSLSCLYTKKYEEALQAAQKGYNLDTSNIDLLGFQAHVLLFMDEYDKAKEIYLSIRDDYENSYIILDMFNFFEESDLRNDYFDSIRELLEE